MNWRLFMWLQLLIHLLPMLPNLVSDIEGAVEAFKNDPQAAAKANQAALALKDIGIMVDAVIEGVKK